MKETVDLLSKLDSGIGGAVDWSVICPSCFLFFTNLTVTPYHSSIIKVDESAILTLEAIKNEDNRNSILFYMFPARPRDHVLDTFVYAATLLEKDLAYLVSQQGTKLSCQIELIRPFLGFIISTPVIIARSSGSDQNKARRH
jgi:hypothetical protein